VVDDERLPVRVHHGGLPEPLSEVLVPARIPRGYSLASPISSSNEGRAGQSFGLVAVRCK
jgi:hypothetical protein